MKFKNIINELRVPIVSSSPLATKLREYRGINLLILDEGEPPDVHGIPKELEAYGRGGFTKDGRLWIDGGPQGSATGHPNFIENGFYWGADYDVSWKSLDGMVRRGIVYIRGRAGTETKVLEKRLNEILEQVFRKLPKNDNVKLRR